jgi:hypothetical protein
MLWVTTGGREFRFKAKIRRFSKTLSSSDSSSSGVGMAFDSLKSPFFVRYRKDMSIIDSLPMEARRVIEQSSSNTVLDFSDGIPKLLGHGLALEGFDRVRVCGGRHNNERDDSDSRSGLL